MINLVKILAITSMAWLFTACASSPDISVDYSPDFHSKHIGSYHLITQPDIDTLADQRIVSAINSQLKARGLAAQSKQQADIWVSYLVVTKDRTKVNTYNSMAGFNSYGYGYGPRYGGGWGTTTNVSVYEYTEGTLLIDLIDPKTNKTVWRGTGSTNISVNRNAEQRTALIESYVAAIVDKMYQQPEAK